MLEQILIAFGAGITTAGGIIGGQYYLLYLADKKDKEEYKRRVEESMNIVKNIATTIANSTSNLESSSGMTPAQSSGKITDVKLNSETQKQQFNKQLEEVKRQDALNRMKKKKGMPN